MTFLMYILFGIIGGLAVSYFELPFYVFFIFVIIVFLLTISNMLYTTMRSKNMNKISTFLRKQKKNPVYNYLYLLPTRNTQDLQRAFETITKKYKGTKFESVYGAHFYLVMKDYEKARTYVELMKDNDIREYMLDLLAVLQQIPVSKKTYAKQWMNDAIDAYIAYNAKNRAAFEQAAEASLLACGGIQYYGNYYAFAALRENM